MSNKVLRVLATAAAGLALSVGFAPTALAVSPSSPPMPEGAGYWCEVSRDVNKRIDCGHVSIGKRWNDVQQNSSYEVSGSTSWTISTYQLPDLSMMINQCQYGNPAPACMQSKKTGVPIADSVRAPHLDSVYAGSMVNTPIAFMFNGLANSGGLYKGQWLMAPNGRYGLTFQPDGNLVAYGPNSRILWSSGTWGNPGANFHMQADGNAVIYAPDGTVLWTSKTWGNSGARLTVQDDGNVVIYRSNGSPAWYTGWDRSR